MPEKVPEKTPGAWLTKLSITAPGLRLAHELELELELEPELLLLKLELPHSACGQGVDCPGAGLRAPAAE